jgi:hypothetical protein
MKHLHSAMRAALLAIGIGAVAGFVIDAPTVFTQTAQKPGRSAAVVRGEVTFS